MTQIWRAFHDLVPLLAVLVLVAGGLFVVMLRLPARGRCTTARVIGGLWLIALLLITLRPQAPIITLDGNERPVQLVPFKSLYELVFQTSTGVGLPLGEIGGNLMLFAPLGVLAPFLWPTRRHLLGRVALAATGVATVIETIQWGMATGRQASVDDVILAVVGAVLAYALTCAAVRSIRPFGRQQRAAGAESCGRASSGVSR